MDWATLLLAAGLSGGVSWFTARQVAIRGHRAGDDEAARRELQPLLAPVGLELRQYRAGLRSGRESGVGNTEDAVLAGQVLALADRLPTWRRRLVRRRLARLVGPVWMETAALHPPGDGQAAFSIVIAQQIAATRRERSGQHVDRSDDLGLLHRALCSSPESPSVDEAIKQVRRLSQGW